jgi:hypothetical protein
MRRGTILILVWLMIGAAAAGQRGLFDSKTVGCTQAATIAITMVAGPLNYLGVDSKWNCRTPMPAGS